MHWLKPPIDMLPLLNVSLPIILLVAVFIAIAIRKVGQLHLPIWLIMLIAAIIVLISGDISIRKAYHAINFEVLFYLFGVFIIGQALESSHYLEHLSFKIFKHANNLFALLLLMIIVFAFSSALLMNDTIAIIGTPVILILARQHQFDSKPFLLALAYSITLGSVFSPIGNPQNLLIAMSNMHNPFVVFLKYLFIPTLINLAILYLIIWLRFKPNLKMPLSHSPSLKAIDSNLARLSQISLILLLILILLKIILSTLGSQRHIPFSLIALISAAPILLFSNKRFKILRCIDWHTLVFFIGLFIFMKSVWLADYFQPLIATSDINLTHKASIFSISVLLSQFISNVPLVALYLPLLHHASNAQLMALAAGSTIAGNLLILGAASNVIIIQNAEKRGKSAFSFWEFVKLGLPLTLCNSIVYYLFLP